MTKKILILLTKTLFAILLYTTPIAHAQPDNFNYSTAVGMILYVDGGGHIFQRPDHDEPRNFFIIIYGIVGKYAVQMQPQHSGLTLNVTSLPVEEKILLINHHAQKLLFLGDHWIGDGQQFSIMESSDYHRLKQLFAETRKHRGNLTENAVLEGYSEYIHKIWEDNSEEFYREFYFPDSKLNSTTSSTDTRIAEITPEPNTKEMDLENENGLDNRIEKKQQNRHAEGHQNSAANQKIKPFTGPTYSNPSTQEKAQDNPIQNEKTADSYFKFWIFGTILVTLLLVAYWWLQTK